MLVSVRSSPLGSQDGGLQRQNRNLFIWVNWHRTDTHYRGKERAVIQGQHFFNHNFLVGEATAPHRPCSCGKLDTQFFFSNGCMAQRGRCPGGRPSVSANKGIHDAYYSVVKWQAKQNTHTHTKPKQNNVQKADPAKTQTKSKQKKQNKTHIHPTKTKETKETKQNTHTQTKTVKQISVHGNDQSRIHCSHSGSTLALSITLFSFSLRTLLACPSLVTAFPHFCRQQHPPLLSFTSSAVWYTRNGLEASSLDTLPPPLTCWLSHPCVLCGRGDIFFFSWMLHGSTKVVVRAVALLSANTRINRMSLSKVVYVSESNN